MQKQSLFSKLTSTINSFKIDNIVGYDELYDKLFEDYSLPRSTINTTIDRYISMLQVSGFVDKRIVSIRINATIPDYINTSNIANYVVVEQEFETTDEHKTGWQLSSRTFMNAYAKFSEYELDRLSVVEHFELDKHSNPLLVLFKK
jgi:hypothetical protein